MRIRGYREPCCSPSWAIYVYKVHHYGSQYSSNSAWLDITRLKAGIILVRDNDRYGYPAQQSIDWLHEADVKTFWTSRRNGGDSDPDFDVVSGSVGVQTAL